MNGRKARAQRKARQSLQKNNLARKAARLEIDERDRKAREAYAELVRKREALIRSANEAARKAIKEIEQNRKDAHRAAWEDYEKGRAEILTEYAARKEVAAA